MGGPEDAARAERLAAALRANLTRRKRQARGRQAGTAGDGPSLEEAGRPNPNRRDPGDRDPDKDETGNQ